MFNFIYWLKINNDIKNKKYSVGSGIRKYKKYEKDENYEKSQYDNNYDEKNYKKKKVKTLKIYSKLQYRMKITLDLLILKEKLIKFKNNKIKI